ncbi:50S ribosomal protein L32 [Caldicellulosiruptor changbaiensis]|uniref:Large ribosomal subunit protein bL32 n=3 Tax=Caldicellulosiruptor TaxID=44000 RepID=RL32_CALS8|nr:MULTISPECIES: 50S ribosomal protein L32 [Caldicellulosiruptor]A4XKH4.1 RecName: Full=Large ribosomal subunit protein bL32; AltName: Full=50S ribosomal protein L32 [Caldicellulosiruptor saccharolyticus DSM 8903]ABP67409.1 ribosomal protein L32 [Caldicellulosiruptor saccharolyticus DSM 8903]AZT90446.1 50S ribosomal protein L32 [Caldicellulosiruptor changbaiensis]WAM30701.1 50S ribosomal protein L32 [Caldicellulosiruptor naganoensis]
MAQPKRRWSKQRTHKHRANWKIEAPNLVECPQCHEMKLPHRVCPSCGYYKNRKVVNED